MRARLVKGYFKNDYGIEVIKKEDFGFSALHGHDFYEMDIILGGKNSGSLNRDELEIKRGEVFFLTPEDFHEYSDKGELDILNLHFTEDFISKDILYSLVSCGKRHFFIPEEKFLRFERLSESLYEHYCNRSGVGVVSRLTETLLLLLLREIRQGEITNKSESIQKAIVYINAHFKENPSLSEVSGTIPYNERYFCKKFKEYTGESYKDYLKKLKLEYARRLLMASGLSVIEISERSGYHTPSHFNREFKAYFGVTPREIRNKKI